MISYSRILKRLAHTQNLQICLYFTIKKYHFYNIFSLTDDFINVSPTVFLQKFAVKLSSMWTSIYV